MGLGAINIDTAAIGNFFGKVIDKIFPDKTEAERIKTEYLKFQMSGNLEELKTILAPFLAEAQSSDKWTSRARPSFMYVMYLFILFGIPMGILSVFSPESAKAIAEGMQAWMAAIPTPLWAVFGTCFSVYSISRSYDKSKGNG